jgi:hypothetical protein
MDNVRNSKAIAETVGLFLAEPRSRARVDGPPPEVITCTGSSLLSAGIERLRQLLGPDGFNPNQVMLIVAGPDAARVQQAARQRSVDVVHIPTIARFPLPPTDLRVAFGTPDEVQGLEAQVVLLLHHAAKLGVGEARDLYVALSRARSHLIIVGTRTLDDLAAAARAALVERSGARA